MSKHNYLSAVKSKAIKAMASFTEAVAVDSTRDGCWVIMHKPEEPENLAQRVALMKKQRQQRT